MSQKQIIKRLHEEAKSKMIESRKLMDEAREQEDYTEFRILRARAMDYRDFADDLEAISEIYEAGVKVGYAKDNILLR